ncbi:cell cycle checkpoint protein [Sporothrix schenckii 1099-18]|uniref:Cell cycle checkpoint protein n=1 Tax=Sporothrix schenckii 1099-18 TaxID=1397361 RepID=A0A0F2LW82_SPOSC|nr:cell cycle checkpoint protein [Sporothrix schenckii 1099-18]KJR81732.1 cell cycle checkpoint protein [Sporothrix schenckii 1099-18]
MHIDVHTPRLVPPTTDDQHNVTDDPFLPPSSSSSFFTSSSCALFTAMPPRRKRNVLDDSDSEDEKAREQRKTSLRNFFSPNKTISTSTGAASDASPAKSTAAIPTTPTASPTPTRRTRVAAAHTKTPTKSPSKNSKSVAASSPAPSSPFGRILSSRVKDSNSKNGAAGTNGNANGGGSASAGSSPCPSPEKRRGNKALKGQVDERGKSADLVALFTKQAEKAQNSPPKKTVRLALDVDMGSDPIASEDDDIKDDDGGIAESSAVVASYVGSRAQKRWKSSTNGSAAKSNLSNLSSQQLPSSLPLSSSSALPISTLTSSQRFKRPIRPGGSNGAAAANDDDLRPWSERFAPTNLDELAVHKKKVTDVRRWLDDVMHGHLRQRLLVLKGAAGTGKTTTVRLLAKDMNLDVLEWRNPTGAYASGATPMGFTSAAAQFDEFLNRGSKFSQLDLEDTSSDSDDSTSRQTARTNGSSNGNGNDKSSDLSTPRRRKVIVIEEFPNTFMRSSSALTGFRNSVLQYLAANTPSLAAYAQRRASFDPDTIAPVIMIVSETLLTTTSASADSFTAHRLLGPEILRHPGTGLIEFNAIAPSLLAKALELIVQKEARKSGRRRTPGPLVLKRLGEVGDVRSAVASLEFLCVKGDDQGDWGAKVAFTKSRKGPKDAALTKGERETLEMVSQREASLGVFHAVGKVVYNKREDLPRPPDTEEALAEMLPDYFAHHARPKRTLVAADTLIDEIGTDTHTFISALHENYALSCEQTGPHDPMSSVDYLNGCIEYLSESDLLCPTWDIFFGGRGSNRSNFGRDSGSHVLRQDEMAFQVAVRGLLFSLPSPVKRSSGGHYQRGDGGNGGGSGVGVGAGGGGNQFKMFYPMSLKLWRSREEMEALVDVWSSKLLRGEVVQQGGGPPSTQQSGGNRALSFRRSAPRFSSNGNSSSQASGFAPSPSQARVATTNDDADRKGIVIKKEDSDHSASSLANISEKTEKPSQTSSSLPPPPLLSLGSSARKELLLERLPYMALIARSKRCSFGSMGMRDLEKVVSFHGIGAAAAATGNDDADEDAADANSGIGAGMSMGDDAWATDRPTDDSQSSPRKPRRPLQAYGRQPAPPPPPANGRASKMQANDADDLDVLPGLPMYNLYLSDDDIEEVD